MRFLKTISCLLLTFSLSVQAQKGFNINIKVQGLNDSLLILATYSGDKQFITDTAFRNKTNGYTFSADTLLPEGMYIIANLSKVKLFDFIISGKQVITITGDIDNIPASLTSKNSEENKILFDYINFLSAKQKEMAILQQSKAQFQANSDTLTFIANRIQLVNEEVLRYINGIINTHHGKFISVFLNSMQEIEVPPAPILSNGRPDSLFAFNYYKAHYWDNTDLSDGRLVRTPTLHSKVEQYITKLTHPIPDSLVKSIDKLISMTGNNKETFKYLIWYLTTKYEASEIMGQDAVFVHIVDTWYGDQRMTWMNPTVKQNLIKKANTLRPILLGKIAPEMILIDTLQQPISLHAIKKKYTIIFFWDPDCGHCKKETPLLKDLYENYSKRLDLEVYAVCMDTSWNDMKKYIIQNNTKWINVNGFYSMTPDFRELYDVHSSPVLFLLDEKKKIIAKKILSEQMKNLIFKREGIKE